MKPKVIFFIGGDDAPGGVTGYINSIVNNLPLSVFEFHATASRRAKGGFYSSRISIRRMSEAYRVFDFIPRLLEFRATIRSLNPTLVHAHTLRAGALSAFGLIGMSVPFVYTGHSWRSQQKSSYLSRTVFELIERFVSRRAAILTFLSRAEMEFGVSRGYLPRRKGRVVNTRISEPLIRDWESETEKHEREAVIINVGEVCDRKNPLLFLEIAKILSVSIPSLRFVWVGGGELLEEMREKAASLRGQVLIEFVGDCANQKVFQYLQKAKVFLFTSKFEGVPLVLLEARLLGVPVVSSNYPGVDAVVAHSVDGFVFDKSVPHEACEYIKKLVGDKDIFNACVDQALRRTLENNCRPELMGIEYAEVYKQVECDRSLP